jgi:filamentous hemagglutinin family protein
MSASNPFAKKSIRRPRFITANPHRALRARKWLCLFVALLATLRQTRLYANPTGMSVAAGHATAQQIGSQLNIAVSQAAILNWQSFNIGPGETTAFLQPSANSVVLNVIGGANPSQIFGSLKANGTVILENAGGFYFGPNSMVSVGGSFLATTAPLPPDFGSAAAWKFTGLPPLASIVNYGQIQVGSGKSLFLIAENIENHGSLNAPGGTVDLAAGQSVLVSESPDGRGLSAAVTLPQGSVDNFGRVTADGGSLMLQAQVVNQNGLLQADSVQNKNGLIELVASDQLNLGANSQILARGDDSPGGSPGGNVTLKSQNIFSDATGSQIVTTGGAGGGNGGNIEVSAPNIQSLNSAMDASAQSGFTSGEFLLDPVNIELGTSASYGGTMPPDGIVPYNTSGNLLLNVNTAFKNKHFSEILLEASGNISLDANTTWNLSSSTGENSGQLTLEAGGNITFGSRATILDANDWNVSLYAGVTAVSSTALTTPTVQAGSGNIYLNGGAGSSFNGSIQTSQGSINLEAGNGIFVGKGCVVTTGGGNIFANALSGDISTGTAEAGVNNTGYTLNNESYNVTTAYGGIGTYDGGNLTLIAGDSINPISTSKIFYGVAGAFGSAPGNVALIANNQISGTFNVANGTGTMLAGVSLKDNQPTALNATGSIGTPVLPVTLGLIGGPAGAAWNLWAADNIYLLEVRNPNGSANAYAQSVSGLFDYAPNATANLWAGNGITLGSTTTSVSGNGAATEAVYCPGLDLTAGAGGITIYNSIVLFPSSQGSLKISDGGDLTMSGSGAVNPSLTMSDSALTDYQDQFSGHADMPLHISDPNPVSINVAGNINDFDLIVPTFADITVGGSTYDFSFAGQNLSPLQTTTISVTGDITYPGTQNLPGLSLAGPGNFDIFARNISLGVSGGITVDFPAAPDAALDAISSDGANLTVKTTGDLDLTASEIADGGIGGNIVLSVGGVLNAGGTATTLGSASAPKGIFTTSGGNIAVNAVGNVNIDGSRIAAFNGGNVDVTSQTGDVDAGTGGQGSVVFTSFQIDPQTGQLTSLERTIPFSGIVATTVFGDAELGNITVNAPEGSVNSSVGGIVQIAFNNANTKDNFIDVTAGKDINATGSGVIGYNVKLQAAGDITGVVVGSQSVAVTSQQSVDVTAVSGGDVNISASGTVSGTVIGGGSVAVSGSSIDAAIRGGSVSTSGDTSSATVGVPAGPAAPPPPVADNADAAASKTDSGGEDDDQKKKKAVTLAQKISRVTVILPGNK